MKGQLNLHKQLSFVWDEMYSVDQPLWMRRISAGMQGVPSNTSRKGRAIVVNHFSTNTSAIFRSIRMILLKRKKFTLFKIISKSSLFGGTFSQFIMIFQWECDHHHQERKTTATLHVHTWV